MKRFIAIILCASCCSVKSFSQEPIVYSFEKNVTDTLMKGESYFESLYHLKKPKLLFYGIVVQADQGFGIYLQAYKRGNNFLFKNLVKATNRFLFIGQSKIPLVFPTDILSEQLKLAKIAAVPLSGYYVEVGYENNKQKVINTKFLF